MQVSENAASGLVLELVHRLCHVAAVSVVDDSDAVTSAETILMHHLLREQLVEEKGVTLGLRLAERLLYREPSFGGRPLDVARFVGYSLWRALFGKRVDSVKHVADVFDLSDKDLKWLQGFPRPSEGDIVVRTTATIMDTSEHAGGEAVAEVDHEKASHVTSRDVIVFLIGIIRGATHTLIEEKSFVIEGSFTRDGEVHLVLNFRHTH